MQLHCFGIEGNLCCVVGINLQEGASSPAPEGNVEMGEGGRPVRRGKVATRGKREGGPRDNTPPPVKKGEVSCPPRIFRVPIIWVSSFSALPHHISRDKPG